jgi:hypothetical protein
LLAPTTHDVLAFERNALVLEQLQHAIRRTRREHGAAHDQPADIVEMEAVDILLHGDRVQNARNLEPRRQRKLNENAMNVGTAVEFLDLVNHDLRIDVQREVETKRCDPDVGAGPDLVADIDLRRRVRSDEDDREAGRRAALGDDVFHALAALRANLGRDRDAVDDRCCHARPSSCSRAWSRRR